MPVSFLPFGAWAPDTPDLDGATLAEASGVLPVYGGYRLWPAVTPLSYESSEHISGAHVHMATSSSSLAYGRPDEDTSTGDWINTKKKAEHADGTTLYSAIDEVTPDESDTIRVYNPSSATCKLKLSGVADPGSHTGHVIRFRYRIKNSSSSWTLDCNLLEDTTEIADINASGSADVDWTTATTTLSTAEAGSITDYDDLYFTLVATVPGSTQYARPDDDLRGGWWKNGSTTLTGSTTGYTTLDETSASDSDFVKAKSQTVAGKIDTFEFGLSNVTDPALSGNHVLHYRYKGNSGTETFRIRLKQGTTVIKEYEHTTIGTSWTTQTQTLSDSEADSITNYKKLSVEVEQETVDTGTSQVSVSWIQFAVPAASFAEVAWAELEVPQSTSEDTPDAVTIYSGGPTELYTVDETGFTDVGKGGGYGGSGGDYPWDFCSYGDHVIATNRADEVQWDEDAGGAFADLITSTQKPNARFCETVRDHLILADISYTDGASDMVWWSALGDPQDFDFTTGDETLCGRRRLRSLPGGITALVGGEDNFLAFKRDGIIRGDWIGAPYVFNTYTVSDGVGTPWPKSVVADGNDVYFFGSDGLPYVLRNRSQLERILRPTHAKFLQDGEFEMYSVGQIQGDVIDQERTVIGAKCSRSGLIFWAYAVNVDSLVNVVDELGEDLSLPSWRLGGYEVPYAFLVYNPADGRTGFSYTGVEYPRISAMISMPNTVTDENYLLKGLRFFFFTDWTQGLPSGVMPLAWEGSNFAAFSGPETQEATFKTKVMTAGGITGSDQRNILIHRMRPVFRAEPNADKDLDWTLTVEYGDNFQFLDADVSSASADTKKDDGWFNLPTINCGAFQVTGTIASTTGATTKDLLGIQVDWEPAGRSNAA